MDIPFNIPVDRETKIRVVSGGTPPEDPAVETLIFPVAEPVHDPGRSVRPGGA